QQTARKVRQAGAFVSCLQAQNTEDKKAKDLRGTTTELSAAFQNALTAFDQKLASLDQSSWEQIINDKDLIELSFVLNERRENASEKLSQEEETVINALAVDGYHGWGQMYDVI
ncbi:hypothetical protein OSK38_26665, partial [Escherichia coli]|nr:hypothetical protein [Escherichia coli]